VSEQVRDERNLAGAIYGTILATSVVAGLSEGGTVDKGPAALVVITSSLVFWLAHVYAGVLGHHLQLGHGFRWSRVGAIARHEWPILASGIPPAIVLALGTIGLFERDPASRATTRRSWRSREPSTGCSGSSSSPSRCSSTDRRGVTGRGRGPARSPNGLYEASAFVLMASNSAWVIDPLSRRPLAFSISAAGPLEAATVFT